MRQRPVLGIPLDSAPWCRRIEFGALALFHCLIGRPFSIAFFIKDSKVAKDGENRRCRMQRHCRLSATRLQPKIMIPNLCRHELTSSFQEGFVVFNGDYHSDLGETVHFQVGEQVGRR